MRLVVFLLIGLEALLLVLRGVGEAQILDSVVARVDSEIVTWSRVVQESKLLDLLRAGSVSEDPAEVRDRLVRRRLLVAEAGKLRLDIDVETAKRKVDEIARDCGGQIFWDAMQRVGVHRSDLEERAAQDALVEKYLNLRRELTFVPESEVRAYFNEHPELTNTRELAAVRDEVRTFLAEKKYQEELEQWLNRQRAEGRVEFLRLPEGELP